MSLAAVVGLVPYLAILWDLKLDPLRTALPSRQFSNFYDLQARALLDGHLDVAKGVLGIEAFVVNGHEQMYFPPGPALARMPLFLVTDALDGRLTAISMLLAWIATTVLITLLVWRVRHLLRGAAPMGRAEAAAYGLLLIGSTSGSVLLFLGSLPWVYHEAYAWATVMALGSAFCLLGVIERPSTRRVLATGGFILGAILCRTTAGWACAGAAGLTALWFLSGRQGTAALRTSRSLFLACLLPVAVGVAINEARFDHPYLFPLEDQVWTQVNEHRREALAANGGDLISPDILPSTAVAYFRPDGIRVVDVFPFLTLPAEPARAVGRAVLDQTYRTGSVVAFMPGLTVLAAWGMFTAFRRRGPDNAALLRIPLLGALAISGAIMFYGYIAYRYTSELLPVLVLAGTVGLVDVARRLQQRRSPWQKGALVGLAGLVAFGVAANSAAALTTARTVSAGPDLQGYIRAQDRLSSLTPGDPLGDLVSQSAVLPHDLPADHLHVVGDCNAVYVSTGDTLWPWMPVEVHQLDFEVRVGPRPNRDLGPTARGVTLATAQGFPDETVRVERHRDQRFRLAYTSDDEVQRSGWAQAPPDGLLYVTIRPDLELDAYVVGVNDELAFFVPISDHNRDWFREQYLYQPSEPTADALEEAGLRTRLLEPHPLETCERLRRFLR
jgi:hypothetical protein